ncbi:hypothetical protein GNP94_01755 [Paenibacillus campinasensis]|uniref:ABC transporter permease n=1 Tax=Paenibacillus campinasensis TaxID=66347 RepID=A0ABW9SUS4_9BACL|nr:hypothetical protein [Paenibacillus campinasensis]MUG64725.1 hypothetical protein [Paenibacillus campinasensis]
MREADQQFRILRLLDRLQPLLRTTGIHYPTLRRILQVKLLMDRRRVPTLLSNRNRSEDEEVNYFVRSLWLYALLGLMLVLFMMLETQYMLLMSLVMGILMFFIMMSMISDFSAVMLDVRDRSIIMTRPVDGRTVGMARAIHTAIYLLMLTGSLAAASLVAGLIKHGVLFFVIYVIELVLVNLLILVVTSVTYLLLMKYLNGEKLKDIINYVQIGLTVVLAVGYQFVIRSFNFAGMDMAFEPVWWQLFLPPVWYAAPYEWLIGSGGSAWLYLLSALALIVPIILLMLYVRLMASFEQHLEKLAHSDAGRGRPRDRFDRMLSKLVCRTEEERSCFRFSAIMLRTEREFKLKVYPSLGMALFFPYLFLFSMSNSGSAWSEVRESSFFYFLYMMPLMIISAVFMLKYSGKSKAFWLFGAAPFSNLDPLYKGALKAFVVKIYLPLYFVNATVFAFIFGSRIIPDLLGILLVGTAVVPLFGKVMLSDPPFSQSFSMANQSGGGMVFAAMLVLGAVVAIHIASRIHVLGMAAFILALLIINVWGWKRTYSSAKQSIEH